MTRAASTLPLSKATGILLAGQACGRGLRFVGMNLVLARLLGPEAYGALALAFYGMQVLHSVSALGLYNGLQHYVPALLLRGQAGAVRRIIHKALVLGSGAACIVGLLWGRSAPWLASAFDNPLVGEAMSRFAWALPFFVLSTIAAFALNSLGRPLGYTLFRDVFPYFAMFLGIGAWSLGEFSLQRVCTGAAFGLVACGISSALITLCAVPAGNGKFLGEVGTGQLLRFSLPTAVSAMASLLYLQSDRVMLGLLSSESDVGVYSVAASIATQLLVLPGAVAIVLAPKFALHNVERNDNEGHATYSLAMGWVIFLMVVAGCLLALLSRPLLQLCGEEYVRGSAALALLSIGTMLGGGVSSIAGYSLSISGRPNVALGISLLAAGTNMAVNAVLIPRWGLEGAAVGTSVGLLLAAGLSSAALFRHTGFRGMAPSRRPFLWISLLIASVALTSSMIGSQYLGAGMVAALGLTGIWVFWRSSPGGNIQGRNE